MGLISSIKKAASKVKEVAKVVATKVINDAGSRGPLGTKITPDAKIRAPTPQEAKKEAKETIRNVALGGAGLVIAANPSAAASAAKSLIPKSTAGKVAAGALALPTATLIASNPTVVIKGLTGVANVEKNLIKIAGNPTKESLKELVTENPVIVGGAVAAGALLGLKAGLPAISSLINTQAIKENTEAVQTSQGTVLPSAVAAPIPITPATQTVQATKLSDPNKTTKRRRSKPQRSIINQRVNVLVSNKSSSTGIRQTKKYLNREVLIR